MPRSNVEPALRALALAGLLGVLAGCASVALPPPSASGDVVQRLRTSAITPVSLGGFVLAPGKDPAMDRTLGGLRGSSLSPTSGSFAKQLEAELAAQLQAAGLYDAASKAVISGQLTDSRVDAAIGTGTGRLAARFVVTRDGRTVFDRELAAESSWDSSFIGAVAIPAAMNQYGALYKKLVAQLFDDPAFRTALAR